MFRNLIRKQQRNKREGGQSLLEFALTFPLLIILLLAMVVIAWVGFSYVSITSAARMGARWMLNYPAPPTGPIDPGTYGTIDDEIKAVVFQSMPMLDTSAPATEVGIWPHNPDDRVSGTQVRVTITHTVNLPTITIPYVIVPGEITLSQPLPLRAQSRMRLE